MKRVKSFFKGYMRAIEINAALMYGYSCLLYTSPSPRD